MIPPQKFKELLEEKPGIIIDVRTPREYEEGYLKKVDFNIDISADFEQNIEELNKDNTYYLYCGSGARSERATQLMKRKGFENVYNVGGLEALIEAGFEKQ
ncbi:rhodanese-like domain-containing protein [Fodinibius sp. Rm-B-1B1-1]|uniref:rhodanese-like domain-containing protein n=1 Tax=Fodinibius alkaliphilus TaxID=3140241 RepID=UPI003159B71B